MIENVDGLRAVIRKELDNFSYRASDECVEAIANKVQAFYTAEPESFDSWDRYNTEDVYTNSWDDSDSWGL